MKKILVVFVLTVSMFTQLLASDIKKLDFSFTPLKTIKPEKTIRYFQDHQNFTGYFAKIAEDGNEGFVGLGDRGLKIWVNGKFTSTEIRVDKVIKPFKNKEFYIGFANGYYGVVFHNLTSGLYKQLRDKLLALKDIDQDGIFEVITLDSYVYNHHTINIYKIIDKNTNPSVTLLFKQGAPSDLRSDGIKYSGTEYLGSDFIYHSIEYFKEDGFLVASPHKRKCKGMGCKKLYDDYFSSFSQEPIVLKTTYHYDDTGSTSLDRVLKHYKVSEREKLKLQYSPDANRLECKKLYNNKNIDTPNILLCEGGKGVIKTKSGLLLVKDFKFDSRRIDMYKTDKYTFIFNKKYLLISDNKTKEAKYLLWKNLLGYQPFDVKYFDANRLIVQADGSKFIYYKVTTKLSTVAKEQW